MEIDTHSFKLGHQLFLDEMWDKSQGQVFTGFDHPALIQDEIAYKWKVIVEANRALSVDHWDTWVPGSGRIVEATKNACAQDVSSNLLEHRFGQAGNSDSPLYRIRSKQDVAGLEEQLCNFFRGGPDNPEALSTRFDQLAKYLRQHRLGCKWPFLAYLAFLLNPQQYFPILPGKFERLLRFYGVNIRISNFVSWNRYQAILHVAEQLKDQLAVYGRINAIEIQSYMWVVAGLISNKSGPKKPREEPEPDFGLELTKRQGRSNERERIGLLGERFVFEIEKQKLTAIGRGDLAAKVRLVAIAEPNMGFDILSYDENANPLHIEVKTTTRSKSFDPGFWLTENERLQALDDAHWTIYRVWSVDVAADYDDLGNLVQAKHEGWGIRPDGWFCYLNIVETVDDEP